MQCFHPSEIHSGGRKLTVPCNRCMACRINKTYEWSTRLIYEMDDHDKSVFITLTYDDDHIGNPSLSKADFQKFIKRVRKHYFGNKESDLAYYLCGEYGPTTFRKHGHAALFGVDFEPDTWEVFKVDKDGPHYTSPTLLKLWPFGFNEVGLISPTRLNYVTGYIQKKLYGDAAKVYSDLGLEPPFQLYSKNLGVNALRRDADRLTRLFLSGKKNVQKYYAMKLGFDEYKVDYEVNPEIGYVREVNLAEARHREIEKENRAAYPELSDLEYAELIVSKRLQSEVDVEARMRMLNVRGKL